MRSNKGISAEAQAKLQGYNWPGNIRELENTIERAIIIARDTIKPDHILIPIAAKSDDFIESAKTLKEAGSRGRERAEAIVIKRMLDETNGNKSEVARRLRVSYKTLLNRIKKYKKENLL